MREEPSAATNITPVPEVEGGAGKTDTDALESTKNLLDERPVSFTARSREF